MHLQKQCSSRKSTIDGTAGVSPPKIGSGKEEPHHKCPKDISVCYFQRFSTVGRGCKSDFPNHQ